MDIPVLFMTFAQPAFHWLTGGHVIHAVIFFDGAG
jgi:hypothetical protein